MANIALIIAGGIGARMGQDIPKQFINVHDKPVIVYTMEVFQKHPDIDSIEVVCLAGMMFLERMLSSLELLNWRILYLVEKMDRIQLEMVLWIFMKDIIQIMM